MSTPPITVPGPIEPARTALNPVYAASVAFIVLDTLFVVARFVSRIFIGKVRLGWDDCWILVAWLLTVALTAPALIIAQAEVQAGLPSDRVILDPHRNTIILKAVYALIQLLLAGYLTTRLSVLCLYLRLFSGRIVRIATWCLIALITVQYVSYAIAGFVQCRPARNFWRQAYDPSLQATCFNIDRYYRSVTGPNIITDVFMILLPIPTVFQLKISRLRKMGITLVLFWSGLALIASCIRLKTYEDHTARYFVPDYSDPLVAWLVIEPGLYLIAACLPAMHHLLVAVIPRFMRNYVESTVTKARTRNVGGPSKFRRDRNRGHPLGSFTQDPRTGNFARLVDSNGSGNVGTHATANTTPKTNLSNNSRGISPMGVEERATGPMEETRLPPDDLRRMMAGDGIMVRTEIITEEEKIEKILGI